MESGSSRFARFSTLVVSVVKRFRTAILSFIGVSTFLEIIKEFFRGKIMEWLASQFGVFGQWLVQNPVSFLTIGIVAALAFIAVAIIFEEIKQPTSVIIDAESRPFTKERRLGWTIAVVAFVFFAIVLVIYSTKKYISISQSHNANIGALQQEAAKVNSPGTDPLVAPVQPPPPTATNKLAPTPKQKRHVADSTEPAKPQLLTQNCPGGICAGRDINFVPPPPPPPTIKVCVSDSKLEDSVYSIMVTFAANVQVFQPGFLMSFDKPVDYGGVRMGFHPLGMNAGIRLETIPHPDNSVGFRIISIDMSRNIWDPKDGPITATIKSASPVKIVKVEGGRGEGDIVHFDKIVLQCDK